MEVGEGTARSILSGRNLNMEKPKGRIQLQCAIKLKTVATNVCIRTYL